MDIATPHPSFSIKPLTDIASGVHLNSVDAQRELVKSLNLFYRNGQLKSLVPILPIMLNLKGKPYTLERYFAVKPFFSITPPRTTVLKCGRQISKSTVMAAQGVLMSAIAPYFSSLYCCPRFEQTRRFSNNYVKPFIETSLVGKILTDPSQEQSVLQRTFKNFSVQHFSFAFLDCERIRGISTDLNRFDEVQDIDPDFIPIINETLSASDYDLRQYSGTPKHYDNPLEKMWTKSSQGEWVTRCAHCNHYNIASIEHDLWDMIQKDGVSCSKCNKEIDPETGEWVAAVPERLHHSAGYHIPQPIMPMHYAPNSKTGVKERWLALYEAKLAMPKALFYNEKLGESCDHGITLLTRSDLVAASTLSTSNNYHAGRQNLNSYIMRVMGVDWGGGGESEVSYTTVAILGFLPGGQVDLLYGERFSPDVDRMAEAKAIMKYFHEYSCDILAHDAGGAGSAKETIMLQAGFPITRVFPACYVRASLADMVSAHPPTGAQGRWSYSVDKARSLVLLCQCIKSGLFKFPKFETWESLAEDLLSLIEDKHSTPKGGDVYLVTRKGSHSDDFAHSINFAACAFWHTQQRYPDIAKQIGLRITRGQVDYFEEPQT